MSYQEQAQYIPAPVGPSKAGKGGTAFAFIAAAGLFVTQIFLYGIFTVYYFAAAVGSGPSHSTLESSLVPINLLFAFGGFLGTPLAITAIVFAVIGIVKKRFLALNIAAAIMGVGVVIINSYAFVSLSNVVNS